MNILVTGGAGFLGSVLVPELLREGHQVVVLDNLTWGVHGLSRDFGNPEFEFIRGDIRDETLVSNLICGKDVVIHLAAVVGYAACERLKNQATEVNVNGTKTLVKHLSKNQLLIYASTGSLYGPVDGLNCSEEATPNPQSHYAITKLKAEKELCGRNNVITLRFATAFGFSPRMRLDLLVNQFVYEALMHKELVIYEKGFIRPVIHVRDIAESIRFAIHHAESMRGQTFNVGSSNMTFTKEQIALHIKKQIDYDLRFAETGHDCDRRNYRISTSKIEGLGYHTAVSLDEGVKELILGIKNLKIDKSFFNA